MRKYFAFIVELIVNKIKGNTLLEVFAEEGTKSDDKGENSTELNKGNKDDKDDKDNPSEPPKDGDTSSNVSINFEDLISKARKEEKEKLYPQINSLKTKVNDLTETNNKHLLTIEEKNTIIKDLKNELEEVRNSKVETESETVKRLQKDIVELKEDLAEAEQGKVDKTELEDTIREELKSEYEVKIYRMEKINSPEYRDKIIPELVIGTSKEEINASLDIAKQRYEDIVNSVIDTENIKLPSGNINTSKLSTEEFTVDDIMNLDPRSEEYAEFRKKMGLR